MISGISSAYASTHAATDFIIAQKKSASASLFAPLCTEKLKLLRKLAEISQGQISSKIKLETTETYTKIVEQKKDRTHPPSRVYPKAVIIPAAPTT